MPHPSFIVKPKEFACQLFNHRGQPPDFFWLAGTKAMTSMTFALKFV